METSDDEADVPEADAATAGEVKKKEEREEKKEEEDEKAIAGEETEGKE